MSPVAGPPASVGKSANGRQHLKSFWRKSLKNSEIKEEGEKQFFFWRIDFSKSDSYGTSLSPMLLVPHQYVSPIFRWCWTNEKSRVIHHIRIPTKVSVPSPELGHHPPSPAKCSPSPGTIRWGVLIWTTGEKGLALLSTLW
jgi:hypothetical protein